MSMDGDGERRPPSKDYSLSIPTSGLPFGISSVNLMGGLGEQIHFSGFSVERKLNSGSICQPTFPMVLYWLRCDSGHYLDSTIGAQPLGSFPYVSAGEGRDGPKPLRLLHARWDVSHDDGQRNERKNLLVKSSRSQRIPAGHDVHVLGVSLGLSVRGFTYRSYFWLAGLSTVF
jgi:hypothetical protein